LFFWPILFNSSFLTTLFFFVMSTAFLSIVSSKIKMFRSRLEWIDHLLLAYTACLLCYMCTFDRTFEWLVNVDEKRKKCVCDWIHVQLKLVIRRFFSKYATNVCKPLVKYSLILFF
jgi:hypothetical protein